MGFFSETPEEAHERHRAERERTRFERQLKRDEELYRRKLEREEEREQRRLEREEAHRAKSIDECYLMNTASCRQIRSTNRKTLTEYIDKHLDSYKQEIKSIWTWVNLFFTIWSVLMFLIFLIVQNPIMIIIMGISTAVFYFFYHKKHSRKKKLQEKYKLHLANKDTVIDAIAIKLLDYDDNVALVYDCIDDTVAKINRMILQFIDNAQTVVNLLDAHVDTLTVKTFDKDDCDEILAAWADACKSFIELRNLEQHISELMEALPQNPELTDLEREMLSYVILSDSGAKHNRTEYSELQIGKIIYNRQTYFGITNDAIATTGELDTVFEIFNQLSRYYGEEKINGEIVKKIKSLEKKAITALKKCYHDSNTKLKDM